MIEVGARYTYQHCMNIDSKWNGKSVTITGQKHYDFLGKGSPTMWYVVDDDGLLGAVFEDELTPIEE